MQNLFSTPEEQQATLQLLADISACLADLGNAVDRLSAYIAGAQGGAPDAVLLPSPKPGHSWRLAQRGFVLIAPDQTRIALSSLEREVLMRLFSAPHASLSYDRWRTEQEEKSAAGAAMSEKCLSILIFRLKRKCANAGVDLPIRPVRGRGYYFSQDTDMTEFDSAS